ncbi:MAG: FkbM family methyltransferase [Actinomycetota bacterium]
MNPILNRLDKLLQALLSPRLLGALLRHRVLAGAEHRRVLSRQLNTVVDIGANRGQFSLAARRWAPAARVEAFEPLPGPADVFRRVFEGDDGVRLHPSAIGPAAETRTMHVSARDDSSSLLPISAAQTTMFPGTWEAGLASVSVAPLDAFLGTDDIVAPAMLKLDVQGYELEALRGCETLLDAFDWVYCECSFVEFYTGQRLADEVVAWLADRDFRLEGTFNPARDGGRTVQADFLFRRQGAAS